VHHPLPWLREERLEVKFSAFWVQLHLLQKEERRGEERRKDWRLYGRARAGATEVNEEDLDELVESGIVLPLLGEKVTGLNSVGTIRRITHLKIFHLFESKKERREEKRRKRRKRRKRMRLWLSTPKKRNQGESIIHSPHPTSPLQIGQQFRFLLSGPSWPCQGQRETR